MIESSIMDIPITHQYVELWFLLILGLWLSLVVWSENIKV